LKFDNYDIVYFLGIGGIGMSALARWFAREEKWVGGYDKTPTPLTRQLETEGMIIHFEDAVNNISEIVKENQDKTLVIYTPAIPKNHKELAWLKAQGYAIHKRSEVLGWITEDHFSVAVAGTHGKTSTSGMIAHCLFNANIGVSGFLGGILQNYQSNYVAKHKKSKEPIMVVEADEFDRSFLRLDPNLAIITSADADHLDIYGDREALISAFREFALKVKAGGTLFVNHKIKGTLLNDLETKESVFTYGIDNGDFKASNVRVAGGYFRFDCSGPGLEILNIKMQMPGFHNIENAVACAAVCFQLGMDSKAIKSGIESYKGVKRRFETVYSGPDVVLIDDYAHHPAEIEAFIRSVRALHPRKKITAIFQPHLFTRTRDFAPGFSASLSLADEVILLPIYPAREEPIAGVSSEMLLDGIMADEIALLQKSELIEELSQRKLEVLLTIGAGDIDQLVEPIAQFLKTKTYAD
jgi:UDP-N-acetylmuramate--alanine ligase